MSDNERVELLLDRWEESQEQGTPVSAEDLCQDCPELLDELKRRIQDLDRVDHFLEPTFVRDNGTNVSGLEAALSGARYQPLRFHARGGLGDVYVAEDVELRREVALKYLRAGRLAGPTERERFLVEAEITGRLEHPGVVPVYGLGQDTEGQPFYAMRFIRGETLVDAIKAFHASENAGKDNGERDVAFQKLLRSFLSICQTMAYAHSRGVIHRDIKPGNVMIGPYGETLLVDWGLAKLLGMPEGSSEYSQRWRESACRRLLEPDSGVVKGSPAYMSPEQAAGKSDEIGPASDIYSLGTTLYALLTGRPPFTGPILEVLAEVKAGLFPPPRQVRPNVPPALEAVCLKAMQRHPADRYASADALAADIERWLAGEPVSAWPEPWSVRARRWLKRHRTLVTTILAVIVVGGIILTVATMLLAAQTVELRQANERENAAKDNERRAKESAQRNFDYARGAVRDIVGQALGNPLLRQPGQIRIQQSLLRIALNYYRKFIAEPHSADPEMQEELAFAHLAVARIAEETGGDDEARSEYRDTEAILRNLGADNPDKLRLASSLVAVQTRLGLIECRHGEWEPGLGHLDRTLNLLDRLVQAHPTDLSLQVGQALTCLAATRSFTRAGRKPRADELRHTGRSLVEKLNGPAGNDLPDDSKVELASADNDLAVDEMQAAHQDAAGKLLDRAAELTDALLRAHPEEPSYRVASWTIAVNRAQLLARAGKRDEGLALSAKVLPDLKVLAQTNPDIVTDQLFFAQASFLDGRAALWDHQYDRAQQQFDTACKVYRAVLKDHPADSEAQRRLVEACQARNIVLRERGNISEARASLGEAQRLLDELRKVAPDDPTLRYEEVTVLNTQGTLDLKAKDGPAAAEHFDKARMLAETLREADSANLEFRRAVAMTESNLGVARVLQNRMEDGLKLLKQAHTALDDLVRQNPQVADFQDDRDRTQMRLATFYAVQGSDLWLQGQHKEALDLCDKAQALFEPLVRGHARLPELHPGYESFLRSWSVMLREEAVEYLDKKSFAEALRLYEKDLSITEQLATAPATNAEGQKRLNVIRMGLALAVQGRVPMLDAGKPADRAEARRILREGLAALDRLPTELRKAADVEQLYKDLQDRLQKLPGD